MGSQPFIPTQPQGAAITNDEIARRRMMNPFAMGTQQAPAQTALAPTGQSTDGMGRPIGATPPFVGRQANYGQPRAVQTVPAGTPISQPPGLAPVPPPDSAVPATDAGQATAMQGLAPVGNPANNVQHTPGHMENAAAIQQRIAQRGPENVNPNTAPGAHHGFRRVLDVLGSVAYGGLTMNPLAGMGMYNILHGGALRRQQAGWESANASDEKQLANERELANSETSYEKMQATDRFHQGELGARDRRITDLETSAAATPKSGTEMQDPTSPTGYTAEFGDGKRHPFDPKKGDPYKGMDDKHWENVLNDPNASAADKQRAQGFLKTEAGQKRAGRTQVNVGDGMSAGEKRDLDATTRNNRRQRDDADRELRALQAQPSYMRDDNADARMKELQTTMQKLDDEYDKAVADHQHHGGKAGGGSKQPAQSPQTHVFSKAAWQKANPQGDVNTVAAQAKQHGYEVTD